MAYSDLAKGMFCFQFKFFLEGSGVNPAELYTTTVFANSGSEATSKFHSNVKRINTSKDIQMTML